MFPGNSYYYVTRGRARGASLRQNNPGSLIPKGRITLSNDVAVIYSRIKDVWCVARFSVNRRPRADLPQIS